MKISSIFLIIAIFLSINLFTAFDSCAYNVQEQVSHDFADCHETNLMEKAPQDECCSESHSCLVCLDCNHSKTIMQKALTGYFSNNRYDDDFMIVTFSVARNHYEIEHPPRPFNVV
jgi:hypothetical protein